MIKYLATLYVANGIKSYELIEAVDEDMADMFARQHCIDLAESYGYYQDEDYFGNRDEVGRESAWNEETEEYEDTGEIEFHVELYDPEIHDGYI